MHVQAIRLTASYIKQQGEVVLGHYLSGAIAWFGYQEDCGENDEVHRMSRESQHRQERHEVAGDLEPHAHNCDDRHRGLMPEE